MSRWVRWIARILLVMTFATTSHASPDDDLRAAVKQRTSGATLEAEAALQKLTIRYPHHATIRYELAVTQFWLGRAEEGLLQISIAMQLLEPDAPLRAAVTELKGRLLMADGHWRQALKVLRSGVNTFPQNPTMRAALGTAEKNALRLRAASESYRAALSLDPENDEAKEGLRTLPRTTRWELRSTGRVATASTETERVGTQWAPGGELYLRGRANPDLSFFGRLTQQLPRWGDPAGPESTQAKNQLTRGELGIGLRPFRHTTLETSYWLTKSENPIHHALLLDGSHKIGSTVLLASARPGLDGEARFDMLGQLGIQQIFPQGFWAMVQGFEYYATASDSQNQQTSTTVVGTIAHEGSQTSLRAGSGIGWFEAGQGYPVFASARVRFGPRFGLGVTYEGFFGFFTQHQFALDGEVRF